MKKFIFTLLVVLTANVTSAQLVYSKGKVYNSNNTSTPIPSYEVEQMMYNQSAFLYNQYKSGKGLKAAGSTMIGLGVPSTAAGIIITAITYANRRYSHGYYYYNRPMYEAGWSLFGIGLGLTATGIPIYSVGLHKIKGSIDSYNKPTASMTFEIKDNGIGLAVAF